MAQFPLPVGQLPSKKMLQPSKWLTFRVLIEKDEMAALVQVCQPLFIGNVSECVTEKTALLKTEEFLRCYHEYIEVLKKKEVPDRKALRPFFSAAWTSAKETLEAFPTPHKQWMIKPVLPIIQLSAHFFSFSETSHRFHSMVYGSEAVPWGLQFSYPQLYALSHQGKVHFSLKDQALPNYALFKVLKNWVRNQTRPARFFFQGKRMNATFRLSQSVANWMALHPSLKQIGLELQK